MNRLAEILRSHRAEWSRQKAATDIGISTESLRLLEGGQTPGRIDTVNKLASWLGVSAAEVVAWAGEEK